MVVLQLQAAYCRLDSRVGMTLLVDCQYSIALPMPLPGVIFMPADRNVHMQQTLISHVLRR